MNNRQRTCSKIYTAANGVKLVAFKNLLKYSGSLVHGFTTRYGGISTGGCTSLNLGFKRKDNPESVKENFRRTAEALGVTTDSMVLSDQVHDKRVYIVSAADKGKGITRDSDIVGYDALATNVPGVTLVTFYADCVPVFLYDPSVHAGSLVHSGWRGTVLEISAAAVEAMACEYGAVPGSIQAAIGPSIGPCCFEVGEDVYSRFLQELPWSSAFCRQTKEDKWHIDLQGIIQETLVKAGLSCQNICISGLCTSCSSELFFSHRRDHGNTGSLAAFMQLL